MECSIRITFIYYTSDTDEQHEFVREWDCVDVANLSAMLEDVCASANKLGMLAKSADVDFTPD